MTLSEFLVGLPGIAAAIFLGQNTRLWLRVRSLRRALVQLDRSIGAPNTGREQDG